MKRRVNAKAITKLGFILLGLGIIGILAYFTPTPSVPYALRYIIILMLVLASCIFIPLFCVASVALFDWIFPKK